MGGRQRIFLPGGRGLEVGERERDYKATHGCFDIDNHDFDRSQNPDPSNQQLFGGDKDQHMLPGNLGFSSCPQHQFCRLP